MIYKAKKKQTVKVVGGEVEVSRGTLVDFDQDPGPGWEVNDGSDSGKGS